MSEKCEGPDALDQDRSTRLFDPAEDPERALEYVLESFDDEIRARIIQVRSAFRLEKHSVFIVLAIATQMLQRMESARDEFSAPFEALREDVLALEKTVETYVDARSEERGEAVRMFGEAGITAAIPIKVGAEEMLAGTKLLRDAKDALVAATNAITNIDPNVEAVIVDRLVTAADVAFKQRFVRTMPIAILFTCAIIALISVISTVLLHGHVNVP